MNAENDGKSVSIGGFGKSSYWAKRKARKQAARKAVDETNRNIDSEKEDN